MFTAEILIKPSRKIIVMPTYLFNVNLKLKHVSICWKNAKMIVSKPGNFEIASLHISPVPVSHKFLNSACISTWKHENSNPIVNLHFALSQKHTQIDYIHRIINLIDCSGQKNTLLSRLYRNRIGLRCGVSWELNISQRLPQQCVYQGDNFFEYKELGAGMLHVWMLRPILYLSYTSDLATWGDIVDATFADDTVFLAVYQGP